MEIIIILLVVAFAVILWVITVSNRFKVLLVKIDESESGVDVSLTMRYDTLTKLMEVVKSFAKHETAVFEKVIQLRSGMSMAEKNACNKSMDTAALGLIAVAENYPELRSSEQYNRLQGAIADAEDHLQAARRVYNMNVSAFNQAIVVFPASIVAKSARHQPKMFFEADEIKRQDVVISL